MGAVFSPNGELVAYTKAERGETTICVERFPSSVRDCLVPTGDDTPKHAQWWTTGDRLYYNPRIGDFGAVSVTTHPELKLETPERVEYHPFRLGPPGSRTPYDVTSRTGRFLGMTTPGQVGYQAQFMNKINVVANWFDVLKEKARR